MWLKLEYLPRDGLVYGNKFIMSFTNVPITKTTRRTLPYLERRVVKKMNDDRWLSFVDSTLMKCTSNIKTFTLSGLVCLMCKCDLKKWIAYVVYKKVENLKIKSVFRTPDCLFQSSTLTKLEIFTMHVNTSATVVNLSALKSLVLKKVQLYDDILDKILLGSPVLENLVLSHCICDNHCRLNIISPSVKMLELCKLCIEKIVFTIKAPRLQELKIAKNFTFANCELVVDVSSLLKATVTFHTDFHGIDEWTGATDRNDYVTTYNDSWIPMVTKLLKSLSYVDELIIGSELIQVLLLSKLSGTPPRTLFMCKHLTIETCLWKSDLPGIACLLENTPHLESLLIKVVPFSFDPKDGFLFYQTQNLFQDGDQHLSMPSGKFLHLKEVKVEYCQMPCHYNIKDNQGVHFEFELVEYILKSGVVLEKLALCSSGGGNCSDSSCLVQNCSYQYISNFCYKLIITIMSLTGNNASGWVFKRSNDESELAFSNYASLFSVPGSSLSSM